ncbi:MAG: sulfatase-like hydrolase/transferase [Acidobacteria bacterium]|nr:sulfatase-like hydrolase/transferase [Acidobacteriota bacterium]
MKRIVLALVALLLGPPDALPAADAAQAAKPNIIMILADDVGLGNLGCTGGAFKTPNLDALAKGGLRFSTCYAMPQCAPSRCVLLTGRYPMAHIHGTIVRTPDSKPGADEACLYADNIEYMDKLVGKLVAEIDRLHLREKTLVVFAGDNGTAGGYTKTATVNGRVVVGHKLKLLEGGSRVPLICNWPGVTPAGEVRDDLVDFSDFFAAFADLGGAKLPEGVKLDGRSFAPQLRGEKGSPCERHTRATRPGCRRPRPRGIASRDVPGQETGGDSKMSAPEAKPSGQRLVSVDALRGFDMFWIPDRQPEETVTLISMGAPRVRICAFPTLGTGASAHQWRKQKP